MGITGPCPMCGDRGVLRISDEGDPTPEGCPECGGIVHMIMCDVPEAEIDAHKARYWNWMEANR